MLRAREDLPVEVWLFGAEGEALAWFDRVAAQWSEAFLCRVVFGPGRPPPSVPLNPLEAEVARLRAELEDARQDLRTVAALVGCVPEGVVDGVSAVCRSAEDLGSQFEQVRQQLAVLRAAARE